jgi:thiol:disulfide interchange protein DsbC
MVFSKKLITSILSGGLLLSGIPLLSHANSADDIAAIKSNLEKRTPPIIAKSIKSSPLAGLYEVFAGGSIFYVDKAVNYVVVGGSLLDDSSKRNLTSERLKELTTIKFESLPLKNAIEIKKGTGAYKFAVFTDPDCPYCKTLEQGLDKMAISDYTAYVFLYPLKELHPDATAKAESIWCSKDKKDSWLNWMVKGTEPAKATCETPIKDNEKLAEEIGVAGTPTIYLNDGSQTLAPQELIAAIKGKK